jgi:aspartyl protease family protein
VSTHRQGSHHEVEVRLTGPSGSVKTLTLLIDTGASLLVLPTSLESELGFTKETLRAGTSQTASGTEPVQIGRLSRVSLGHAEVSDVEVAFLADDKLKGQQLLGMSFLRHFKVTLDDAASELILMAQ